MVTENHSPIGLIAGKGKFPLIFAQESKKNGKEIVVIGLKEEMDQDLKPYSDSIHVISVAKLDSIIKTLKKEGVKEAVMAGGLQHTKIFSELIPDFRAAQLLLKIKDRRADSILGSVAEEFKKDGVMLLPSTTFLNHLIPEPGTLTKRKLNDSEQKNVEFGIRMAQGIAGLDIGQTVVVKKRMVLAVEAGEGTDECIRRAAKLGGDEVIIIKSAKPNQDLRFDVPIIGMNTLKLMEEIKSKVLAIQSKKTIILEKEKCIQEADKNGISIFAWKKKD